MKIDLPSPPKSVGAYVPCVRTGNLVITSGMLPMVEGELKYKGKLGKEMSLEQGQEAAKTCILNALAAINDMIGDLGKIKQIVRVNGYVNSATGFTEQPKVLNAVSDLLVQTFGDIGRHTRIAIGVSELPLNAAVELDLTVQI